MTKSMYSIPSPGLHRTVSMYRHGPQARATPLILAQIPFPHLHNWPLGPSSNIPSSSLCFLQYMSVHNPNKCAWSIQLTGPPSPPPSLFFGSLYRFVRRFVFFFFFSFSSPFLSSSPAGLDTATAARAAAVSSMMAASRATAKVILVGELKRSDWPPAMALRAAAAVQVGAVSYLRVGIR